MLHKVRWAPQKFAQRLELIDPLVYRQRQPLPAFRIKTLSSPLENPPIGADVDDSSWDVIKPKSYWGTWTTDFVLRTSFSIPPGWDASAPVALFLPIGNAGDFSHPEALAYIDGQPFASADRHHHEILLAGQWRDGATHRLELHGWTGLGGWRNGDPDTKLYMRECAVVQLDMPTREFIAAARIALEVTEQLDDNHPSKGLLFNALENAFRVLDTRDPLGTPAFYDSVPAALETLKQGIAASGDPMDVDVIGVGHAHIDVAWLWTLGQTVRKSGRTFSNVLRLMEQFPGYKFSQSQPQLYQYTERHYPEIFEQIKRRVAEGRWEPMGGTWVEPDCNAIGAESLARQFLLGRGYFRKHFGDVDTPVLWLPDTFGYSWALPQLIKQAGMKYFITHKMSWNQYNQMPNQILWWQGLDGTRVLTHFLTTRSDGGSDGFLPHSTTYNGMASPVEIFDTWNNFRQKETHNELITAYGYGDGGGGPTREMLENIEEMGSFPGAPRVRYGTVREFMERIEDEIADTLPVWNGEFYLEYHRGTYTSQGKNKRNNRKSEFLLHDAEFIAAWADLLTDYDYPQLDITQAWELICLNQFHDILPGSSINAVYQDSDKDYAVIRALGEKIREEAIAKLAQVLPASTAVVAINSTSFGGRRVGLLEGGLNAALVDASGSAVTTQTVSGGTLVEVASIEPYSVVGLSAAQGAASAPAGTLSASQDGGQIVLENASLWIEINTAGDISRIYDKEANREVLPEGAAANALLAFEDRPMNFDAWDIDIFYEDRTEKVEGLESLTITEQGPLRVAVEIRRRYRSSAIRQTIYLYRDSRRIDFDTWIDWHEQHILLKAAFPVDVLAPAATFDVQWGNVQRPTHHNTPWDWARFETCAHKWADLSEGNYGVALLNDCKYGYDILDNVIRLSLVKSATSPDEKADQGEHVMTYSLLPHLGDWREEVVRSAYDLNIPLILRRLSGSSADAQAGGSLVSVDAPYVVIETVKRAEDGNGIIVRLYENERSRGRITVNVGFPLAAAYHTNLLEEDSAAFEVQGNQVQLNIGPYEIVSLRLIPA